MRRTLGVFTIALLAAGVASTASAEPIGPGAQVILYDSYGTTGGGEFAGQIVGTSAAIDFISFCLETNEYFTPGQPLTVVDVSYEARAGGSGGPSPDPISTATAWLFTQFSLGTLNGYAFGDTGQARVDSANALQMAFWTLEQEVFSGSLSSQSQTWINAANDAAKSGWSSPGNVAVLNLLNANGTKAQDQLYYKSVPEPGSLFLMSMGFVALVGARSRARKQLAV